jgi:hypothetical protein
MTNRYEMLITAIANSNLFITQMFLFALFAVLGYQVLKWTPAWMQRPARLSFLGSLLGLFLVTVFLSGQ